MATDWFLSDPSDEEKADGIKGPDGVVITWADATDQMKFNSRLLTVLNNLRSIYIIYIYIFVCKLYKNIKCKLYYK